VTRGSDRPADDDRVCYVYGLIPADDDLPDGLRGVHDSDVFAIRHGDVAGVVSEIPRVEQLGSRDDLFAHEGVVGTLAEKTTTLPLRFGAVVTNADAVIDEMLAPHHDWFAAVLRELTARREFVITGTYVEDEVLREVLEENPEVRRLREKLRDLPGNAGYYDRIHMGELIVYALDHKRAADAEVLREALAPHAEAISARRPKGEETAADVAFLVDDDRRAEFERAVDELGERWTGRIRLRLLGPVAPYDFVPSYPEGA
jgi:hypothetical protein